MRTWMILVVCLLLVTLTAASGSLFMPGDWYAQLQKPTFTPPNLAFPIAWTLLYLCMAVAGWRAWLRRGFDGAMVLWLVQLALNALWSYVVFGRHLLGAGAIEIGLLWLAILATMIAFFRRDRLAGWLMTPYLAWVSFALVLNVALWQLNPSV
ncbi:TspO/MBR family protein [Oleiagrimonas soli]|uniref:Tryptophan-rich sensory protein n=1 Tax=Oleiagrimonas soli TaxID=1543381 RepID=A0A099CWN5_9GAMM|nr:TspO/MBR family protein [Oleiagrimonas soli]KGI78027.1 hypothetical protein LF63_0106525 [Oleiagrimonas soli]MBB6183580.1 tryptophan-rich sensory protein [Oleiagrimonas soli]